MKAVASFLLVLSYLSISHGWTCKPGPQQFPAAQIDAGEGSVVMTDESSTAYFLSGSSWYKLGSVPLKHVSVGNAGIWGVDPSNKVYKYVAGDFILSSGQVLTQVDAGGEDQIVGVASSDSIHCLKSAMASAYKQVGSLTWDTVQGALTYFSCSPQHGCWGVNRGQDIFFTKVTPDTCQISGWVKVPGAAVVAEIGSDGSVFVVNAGGQLYQRNGITSSRPEGTEWVQISMCLPVKHASYDLGNLWLVTEGGVIMKCTQ